MVVAFLTAEGECLARGFAGGLEELRLELLLEESVRQSLVDQDLVRMRLRGSRTLWSSACNWAAYVFRICRIAA